MSKIYEIVIFTASVSSYADPIIDALEKEAGTTFQRLYRQHCSYINQTYIKDLSKVGRDITNCIIVDNNPDAYTYNPENAIPIVSWFEDQADTELKKITPILESLTNTQDVRRYIKQIVEGEKVNFLKALQVLSTKGYFIPHIESRRHKHQDNIVGSSYDSPVRKTKKAFLNNSQDKSPYASPV